MKILYTLMLYDFEQKNVVYMKKLVANPAVFPQQVLHLVGNVLETLAASSGSVYNERLVTKNLKNSSNKLQNIHLLKKLTSEILSTTSINDSGDTNGFHVALVKAWSKGLHCSSMKIKENVFIALTGILESVLRIHNSDIRSSTQKACLAEIPMLPLEKLAVLRLNKEMEYYPLISKFCQSLMGLVATLRICSNKYTVTDRHKLIGTSEDHVNSEKKCLDEISKGTSNDIKMSLL